MIHTTNIAKLHGLPYEHCSRALGMILPIVMLLEEEAQGVAHCMRETFHLPVPISPKTTKKLLKC